MALYFVHIGKITAQDEVIGCDGKLGNRFLASTQKKYSCQIKRKQVAHKLSLCFKHEFIHSAR
jgi:hypothetical protein